MFTAINRNFEDFSQLERLKELTREIDKHPEVYNTIALSEEDF